MFRVRNDRRRWRLRRPWKWIFPTKIVERNCRECGFPYNDGPLPDIVASFWTNDVSIQLFPAGSSRRGELVVRVGRWRNSLGKPVLSDWIPENELEDLARSALQALAHYRKHTTDECASG